MRTMIRKQSLALASGVAVGIVIQESLWAAFDLLDPQRALNQVLDQAPAADGLLLPLLTAWIAGGVFGGLMATLVGRKRIAGHVTGLLLSGAALLLTIIVLDDTGRFLAIAATPSIGAALGTGLGLRLLDSEADQRSGAIH